MDNPTVLPDGSAFAVVSLPLPKDHWLYAPRGEWDSKRDDYAETPRPILTRELQAAVVAAARFAIRGATMCGRKMDFDPDALVQNFCYALCGPAGGALLPADDPPAVSEPEALRAALQALEYHYERSRDSMTAKAIRQVKQALRPEQRPAE